VNGDPATDQSDIYQIVHIDEGTAAMKAKEATDLDEKSL
jgi:hypothetical protein